MLITPENSHMTELPYVGFDGRVENYMDHAVTKGCNVFKDIQY